MTDGKDDPGTDPAAGAGGDDKSKQGTEPKTDPKGKDNKSEDKMFSQADVDKIVTERLERERIAAEKKAAKIKADADESARIAALQGEEKIKAEHAAAMRKAAEERDQMLAELKLTKAKAKLAGAGLSDVFAPSVIGETDEATDANIAKLNAHISAEVKKQIDSVSYKGAPAGGKSPAGSSSALDNLMKGAGLNKNKG